MTIALTASDAGGSGVAATRYTTDGTDPTSSSTIYMGPFSVSQATPVKFRSWDNAGNVEATKTQIVRVDTVSPLVSITSPTEGTIVDRRSFTTITAAASDSGSGLTRVAFYGGPTLIGMSTSAPYEVRWRPNNRWSPGEHVLTAVATDAAGNTTASPGVTVTVR